MLLSSSAIVDLDQFLFVFDFDRGLVLLRYEPLVVQLSLVDVITHQLLCYSFQVYIQYQS